MRAVVRLLVGAWVVVPPLALLTAATAGRLAVAEALDLAQWMIVPWALVLVTLALAHVMLGPGRGRRRS